MNSNEECTVEINDRHATFRSTIVKPYYEDPAVEATQVEDLAIEEVQTEDPIRETIRVADQAHGQGRTSRQGDDVPTETL
jgi:hypothetical protein